MKKGLPSYSSNRSATTQQIIAANVALKVSTGDPDYKDMSSENARRDFLQHIKEYEAVYEPITEPHLSYFKIITVGDQVMVCHIHEYLQSCIARST
jgi:6-phosphofructo-2-kinase / fructose-2,6-biphosphatase 2